ncbi:MAG: hypothetical protein ACJ789_20785 [Thermomicrobiales bacterium]
MKPLLWLGPVLGAALLGFYLLVGAASGPAASAQEGGEQIAAGDVSISVNMSDVSKLTGEKFTFTSEITNNGVGATPPLIASLNFTSLEPDTYVDPEDWSPQRTTSVDPIAPGSSATQTWTINPILEGDVASYVVVLPDSLNFAASPLVSSPAIHVHVGAQRNLNPGGVLPVALAVPGLLAASYAGLRIKRTRMRA